MYGAAKGGHHDLVNFFKNKIENDE